MASKIAVVLSGSGVYDGSEIQEAVFTLLALDDAGAQYQCCAPDKPQADVVDHLTGEPMNETRNVLREAARIARGKIVPLADIDATDFDGLIMPGGFGAAKNLCSYATEGTASQVDPELRRVVRQFHEQKKPIAAVCIAPMALASIFSDVTPPVQLTIGNDRNTSSDMKTLGATPVDCAVTDIITDSTHQVITSPAYMYGDARPSQVFAGVNKAVQALLKLAAK